MKISFIPKLSLTAILLLFIILPLNTIEASVEVDVNRLIDGLQNRYGKMKGLAADFTQLYHDRSGRQLREQGMLLLLFRAAQEEQGDVRMRVAQAPD